MTQEPGKIHIRRVQGDKHLTANPKTLPELLAERETALKAEELATLLNCSLGKIYKLVKRGTIPYYKLGYALRFDPGETANWLARRRI